MLSVCTVNALEPADMYYEDADWIWVWNVQSRQGHYEYLYEGKSGLSEEKLNMKAGTQTMIQLYYPEGKTIKWHVNNNINTVTGEKILKIKVKDNGYLNVKALSQGTCTITLKVDGKWYKCPVTVKENSFQKQTTEVTCTKWTDSRTEGKRRRTVRWNKMKGADGYVIYAASQGYCKKVRTVRNGSATQWVDDTADYKQHKEYFVLGYKVTQSKVRIYTKDIYTTKYVNVKGVKAS